MRIDPDSVDTNIVIFAVDDAPTLVSRLADRVELLAIDAHRVRAVTHLEVTSADIQTALEAIAELVG